MGDMTLEDYISSISIDSSNKQLQTDTYFLKPLNIESKRMIDAGFKKLAFN